MKDTMFRVEAGRAEHWSKRFGTLRVTLGLVLLSHVVDVNPPRISTVFTLHLRTSWLRSSSPPTA